MSKTENRWLDEMPSNTLKGNNGGTAATPSDLTVNEVRTMLGIGSVAGGITVIDKTASYTGTSSDWGSAIYFSSLSANAVYTCPTASGLNGNPPIRIVNNDPLYKITLTPSGAETIDGDSNLELMPGEAAAIVSDGTNLRTIP